MRNNQPVSQHERLFEPSRQLISCTDLGGRITYVNDDFVALSGFTREELIGQPHNVIRHPDMPPAAFQQMWAKLKRGEPWLGVVKNRCKNGDHYWVLAYVTPIVQDGQAVGYQSVRVLPQRDYIERAERLYATLRDKAPTVTLRSPILGLPARVAALILTTAGLAAVPGMVPDWSGGFMSLWWWGAAAMVGGFGIHWTTARLRKVAEAERKRYPNLLTAQVLFGAGDELAQLELGQQYRDAHIRTVLVRVSDAAQKISALASQTAQIAVATEAEAARQDEELSQAATAMNEVSASTHEVAHHARSTATASEEVNGQVNQGRQEMAAMVGFSRQLDGEIESASGTVESLRRRSEEIGSVLQVIGEITEQTNLLALNAAIEAARAGDVGRGFAVVADEVRTLAQRTASATEQVRQTITALQAEAEQAANAMADARKVAREGFERAEQTDDTLAAIATAMERISEMNRQIAQGCREQGEAAESILRGIVNVSDVSKSVREQSASSTEVSRDLTQQVDQILGAVIQQFAE
ncbi:MAG TPA: PAS domain-containing methyl-accepting chemotaxis protein [Pseudomonadales bacterium]|nr:PAS domain-containing methyl-accepting chemotaxis protein [Pseudomonadales bacterium]